MSTSPIHTPTAMRNPVGRLTAEHPGLVKLGRVGWLTKGIVYLIAGDLALGVAAKASGWADTTSTTGNQEASPTGAIQTVAGSSGGTLLLWLLAAGLLLYSAWRLVTAFLPGGSDAKATIHRIGYVVSAIIYATFAISTIAGPSHEPGSERQQQGHRHLGFGHGAHRRSLGDRRGGCDHRRGRALPPLQGHDDGRERRARPLEPVGDPRVPNRLGAVGEVGRGVASASWASHGSRRPRLQRRGGHRSRRGPPAAGHEHLGSRGGSAGRPRVRRLRGLLVSTFTRGVASRHPDRELCASVSDRAWPGQPARLVLQQLSQPRRCA